ncbi:MAG: membrane protein insertion efficiency factor YidD [Parcubacteria group bacterium]|nr:membrane protein insertion efficiency factor YidD [Parcubacteria group bacterium]
MNRIAIFFIRAYQKSISPDHSWLSVRFPFGYCKFYPTCSEYAVRCFKKYHFLKAFAKTLWRIARCNPFSKGGIDKE